MDNQINNTINTNIPSPKKFLNKKLIFLVFAIVIIGELIWALTVVLKPNKQTAILPPVTTTPQAAVEKPTTIALSSLSSQVKVGEKFSVSINLSSPKNTEGSDLIINFDPKILSVETIGKTKQPVVVGGIYSEYPVNELDLKSGKIKVSGISSQVGGVKTEGLFGSITFVAKGAGSTKVFVDFQPGGTTDSNVIQTESRKDSLSSVEDLEVNVLP